MSVRAELHDVVRAGEMLCPDSAEALAAEIGRARSAGRRVLPAGDGSRLAALGVPREADILLSTRGLGRVLQYEPADLTVTVEAGCTLAELDRVLAERGQVLPLQPGRGRGTVGGLVATAAEGATALAYGGVRDSLIGLRAALADGTLVKGGGRVVKNVAGYGLHRLMAGSHGTLGVIVEASFKVRPRPEARASVIFELETLEEALDATRRILESGIEPVFVDVLWNFAESLLVVGFEGIEERVRAHLARVAEIVAPAKPAERRILNPEEDAELRRTLDDWTGPGVGLPEVSGQVMLDAARLDVLPLEHAAVRVRVLASRIPEALECLRRGLLEGHAHAIMDIRPGVGSIFLLIESADARVVGHAIGVTTEGGRSMGSAVVLAASVGVARQPHARGANLWGPVARDPSLDPSGSDFLLMKRIKQALDPDGVFASGGFVGGL